MQPFLTLITFAALCTSSLAISEPLHIPQESQDKEYYYLKSVVKNRHPLSWNIQDKHDLYLAPQPTSVGLGYAVFETNKTLALPGFLLDSTRFVFPAYYADHYLGLEYPAVHQSWHPVRLSIAGGQTTGFFMNGSAGLQCKPDNVPEYVPQWAGWLACDWSYGRPQLFWWAPYDQNNKLPINCDLIDLVLEKA